MAQGTCSVDGCERYGLVTRGWCQMHYKRWWASGTTDLISQHPARPCVNCGVEIQPGPRERKPKKWCSQTCRQAFYRATHPKPPQRKEFFKLRYDTCETCGDLRASSASWRYAPECKTCRKATNARRMREQYQADPEAGRARVKASRANKSQCEDCGAGIYAGGRWCMTCNAKQQQLTASLASAVAKTAAKRARATQVVLYDPVWGDQMQPLIRGRVQPMRTWVAGSCNWCGAWFLDRQRARHCSARCATKYHRHRRHAARGRFTVVPMVRAEIYKRDNWICQLCHRPVDPDLPYTDLWSATLDHIEPQSMALIPDHSPANLRLAHRMCNAVRQNFDELPYVPTQAA